MIHKIEVEKPYEVSWVTSRDQVLWEEFKTLREAKAFLKKIEGDPNYLDPLIGRWHKRGESLEDSDWFLE